MYVTTFSYGNLRLFVTREKTLDFQRGDIHLLVTPEEFEKMIKLYQEWKKDREVDEKEQRFFYESGKENSG
jgi:hypothetical protein